VLQVISFAIFDLLSSNIANKKGVIKPLPVE